MSGVEETEDNAGKLRSAGAADRAWDEHQANPIQDDEEED